MRAAIAIGVNRTGGLPPLKGAVSGAERIARWLTEEGFDVQVITDSKTPVTVQDIEAAVRAVVDQPTCEQLVIYFAGHGFVQNLSEYWLLSHAPRSVNEAVIVTESVELARASPIPSVVLVSDACRSTVSSLQAQRVSGGLIFPNDPPGQVKVRVDRFFATRIGAEALEIELAQSVPAYDGIYTHCLVETFEKTPPTLMQRLASNNPALSVIPNWMLEDHMPGAVSAALRQRQIRRAQEPHAIIESRQWDNVHLGRPRSSAQAETKSILPAPSTPEATTPPSLERVGLFRLGMLEPGDELAKQQLEEAAVRSGFDAEALAMSMMRGRDRFETQTGFTLEGDTATWAGGIRCRAEIVDSGRSVRVVSNEGVSSVLITFGEQNTGAVLPALRGYIGQIYLQDGRILTVSYAPSANSPLSYDYLMRRDELERLRAIAATATRHGAFRVSPVDAHKLAGTIRFLKGYDPTLGIYAVYAYNAIGDRDEVKSILAYMRDDIQGTLYDVALLAGHQPRGARGTGGEPMAPFVPALSQGWPLLRALGGTIPRAAQDAAEYMLDATWTTFAEPGMHRLRQALVQGELP